ncbi:MAG: hypothetical protein WCW44_05910 [archaeon]|jgi:hypothetical protein
MEEKESININLIAEKVLFACQENLKTYNKLRLKGKGTRDYFYLVNVPKLFVGEKYSPDKRYSITFGVNKENNHQLVVIDLDDRKDLKCNDTPVLRNR